MSCMRVIPIAPLVLLAGCACEPEQVPVPTPVEVPGPVQYVPIPDALLRCVTDDDRPTTNGALLESWRSRGDRLAECRRSIEVVQNLR